MTSKRDTPAHAPDCGVDAPGVIRGLVAGGLAGTIAGSFARFGATSKLVTVPGAVLGVAALVPLGLGLSMIAYAKGGKQRLRDAMLDRHDWRGDEVVLDIGSGRGLTAIGAAKRVPRGRVVAIDVWRAEDLSDNGPQGLIANAEQEGVAGRIEVRHDDARTVALPTGSVDVILSVLCLHNIEPAAERNRALQEIVRVLKPGGRALIADYIAVGSYARYFGEAGFAVEGPLPMRRVARTSMALIDAVKPLA